MKPENATKNMKGKPGKTKIDSVNTLNIFFKWYKNPLNFLIKY